MSWRWGLEFACCALIWWLGFRTGRTWDRIGEKRDHLR
jgi:hypothetical protein